MTNATKPPHSTLWPSELTQLVYMALEANGEDHYLTRAARKAQTFMWGNAYSGTLVRPGAASTPDEPSELDIEHQFIAQVLPLEPQPRSTTTATIGGNKTYRFYKTWREWDGTRDCPVEPGTRVLVRFRDDEELETRNPEQMRWGWTRPYRSAADIVAYRLP